MRRTTCLPSSLLAAVAASVTAPATAGGPVITVDTVEDVVDFNAPQRRDSLPGPDGRVSFREAVLAANNTPGPDTIAFAIPPQEWWLFDDRAILKLEDGAFVITDDQTVVDGTTQTAFSGDTNPDGWEVGIYGLEPNGWGAAAIYVSADGCTFLGLDRVMQRGYALSISGNGNRVVTCTISGPIHAAVEITGGFGAPPATGNVIGGTLPGESNTLSGGSSGVRIAAPAENNLVVGNRISGGQIGVWLIGSIYSTTVNGNRIGGPTTEERNVIAGAGYYCCEGAPSGGQVIVEYGIGNVIEGNYIGTTPDGMSNEGQIGPAGVEVFMSSGTVVRHNVISGIAVDGTDHYAGQRFGDGVAVRGNCAGTVIEGNLIGTDATGTNAIPNHRGVVVTPFGPDVPAGTRIGGTDAGAGNLIAFSELEGVRVSSQVSGVTITGNGIFGNGGPGIDLLAPGGGSGPTPNDPGDADQGANGLQNFPVVASAESNGATVAISGSLSSAAGRPYALEFFASAACDGSGFGEGATFLGATEVTTDPAGQAQFALSLPAAVATGDVVTATATDLLPGNTSEFSACRTVAASALPGDLDGDGLVGVTDLLALLSSWGNCPGCPADLDGDGTVGMTDLLALLGNWS